MLGLSVLLAGAASGCLNTDPPNVAYNELDASGEVFRVFCRRVAKDSYPLEVDGDRFYPVCDGFEPDGVTPRDPEDETAPELRSLLRRRPEIIASLDRWFGKTPADEGVTFADGELSGFLRALVPLYDKPNETIPTATRGIAQLLGQLTDPTDARANKVLDTVARLVLRKGYRAPDQNLGAVRALFTYPGLDTLAQKLLPVISANGAAHDQWVAVLNSAGLELADEPVPVPDLDGTTLHTALDLLLKEDPSQKSGNIAATIVLQRQKGSGDALPADGAGSNLPTPFVVVDETDTASARDTSGLALVGGKPAYQTFDASQTLLAALMRETSLLIARGDADRSPLENFAHGLKPLLGAQIDRSLTIGQNNYKFTGPDVDNSPLMDLAHASALLARYPETDALLKTLDALIRNHETEATGFDFASMAIADMSKDPKYDGAKLLDNHDFWDDLIAAGERMNKRPGLFDALIRSFIDPRSGAQGKLFATWMRYKDELSYPNSPITPSGAKGAFSDKEAADLNTQVAGPFAVRVDRDSPDVGMNRSIWQRTMSLINALNGVKVCNQMGAKLSVPGTGIGDLNFPAGSSDVGYKECELIEIQDAVEIYSKSVIKAGGFAIKDAFASVLAVLGSLTGLSGNVGQITEQNSQIKGFTDTPSPQSLARFIFATRNKWVTDLFTPQLSKDGLPIADYEPNALFPLEVLDAQTPSTTFGSAPDNFLDIGVPLITAFNTTELRDPVTTLLTDGYMFGHLLSVFHKHWPVKKNDPCPAAVEAGNEGCTQSLDPTMPLYAAQSGLSSYEELLADSFDDQGFVEALHKATIALAAISVTGVDGKSIDGITALSNFVTRLVTPDPMLMRRDGGTTSQSNSCKVVAGACDNNVGRFIPVLSPIVMIADALKRFDDTFKDAANKDRLDVWHQGRSGILDQVLTVDKTGSGDTATYKLRDRTAYNIAMSVLPWAIDLLNQHRTAGDLDTWAAGLSDRAAKILRHPLAGAVVDLLDAFWPEAEASGEFTAVASYLTDENNESSYRGMLTAIADSATLLDRDGSLSPAIQFAALGLAPNAFQSIDDTTILPNGNKSVAYAGLELTGGVVNELKKTQKKGEQTALAKLLNNAAIGDADVRSPLEVLLDATADVNRPQPDDAPVPSPQDPLSADDDRSVFKIVQGFLFDDDQEKRSLERLYSVIQGRNVK